MAEPESGPGLLQTEALLPFHSSKDGRSQFENMIRQLPCSTRFNYLTWRGLQLHEAAALIKSAAALFLSAFAGDVWLDNALTLTVRAMVVQLLHCNLHVFIRDFLAHASGRQPSSSSCIHVPRGDSRTPKPLLLDACPAKFAIWHGIVINHSLAGRLDRGHASIQAGRGCLIRSFFLDLAPSPHDNCLTITGLYMSTWWKPPDDI